MEAIKREPQREVTGPIAAPTPTDHSTYIVPRRWRLKSNHGGRNTNFRAYSVGQQSHLCCTAHKKADIAKSPDNKAHGSTSAAVIFVRTFRFSALLAPNVSMEPKFGRPEMMSSLVHSRGCAKETALFVSSFIPDLVDEGRKCGSRRLYICCSVKKSNGKNVLKCSATTAAVKCDVGLLPEVMQRRTKIFCYYCCCKV